MIGNPSMPYNGQSNGSNVQRFEGLVETETSLCRGRRLVADLFELFVETERNRLLNLTGVRSEHVR